MSRQYQISEEDLEVLEKHVPEICEIVAFNLRNWNERNDVQEACAMLKKIISDVRWSYGPPIVVKHVDPTTPDSTE